MMSSKSSGFTAGDIDRYHSGNMSARERHALEKAALDDPFLADALEGYTHTPTPSADLLAIQSRLDEKLNRKKVVPFYQKYRWLTAAAILLIVAGSGWLVYSISGKQNQSFAVVNKQDQKTKDSNQAVVAHPASNIPVQESAATAQNTKPVTEPAAARPSAGRQNTAAATKRNDAMNERRDKQVETAFASTINPQSTAQNNVAANNAISNNERSRFARVVPSAEPRARNNTDYKFNTSEPNKDVASNAPQNNARPQAVIVTDTTNVNIVMHPLPPDSLGLKEVVVSGYATKKKPVANVYRPHVVIDTLEPEEGYDSFDDYVADNFNPPDEFKSKTGSGEVQLSFDVDRNGQPTNITVVKSLCQKCDDEAIRLLKEGPKWKKKKDKKGKLTITF